MLLMSSFQSFAYLWVFFHKASPYAVDVALSGLGMFMCFFIRIHLMFLMSPFQGFAKLVKDGKVINLKMVEDLRNCQIHRQNKYHKNSKSFSPKLSVFLFLRKFLLRFDSFFNF